MQEKPVLIFDFFPSDNSSSKPRTEKSPIFREKQYRRNNALISYLSKYNDIYIYNVQKIHKFRQNAK